MNIKDLLKKLTLEEKAALLSGVTNWKTTPIPRLGIPSVVMSDGPTGLRKEIGKSQFLDKSLPATCFPLPVTQASTWNPDLIKEMGAALAREAIDQGIDTVLGPGTNIKRHPCGGRNFEYFSEDPLLSGKMASSFIAGVQSQGVGTSLKHFALNNQETRRMTISSEATMRTMREIYLLPFEIAIKENPPETIMCSYNRINGIQASDNKWLLTDVLRTEWGYQGMVMSDWGAVVDRVKGVQAGLDLEMPTSNGANDALIVEAVNNGTITLAEVDRAIYNVLRYVDNAIKRRPKTKVPYDYDLSHQVALKVALEGAVLLKNDGVLPLETNKKVAVIGSMAKLPRYQGSGSSQVNPRKLVSFTDELDHNKISFEYAEGYHDFKESAKVALGKEIVLLFVGLDEEAESEGFDRRHLNLPKRHLKLIDAVLKVNPNVIVVLSTGSPVVMPFADRVKAILNMYLAGEAFGEAAYRLLFGYANPSGKLAETFPKRMEDVASDTFFPMGPQQVIYNEGIYVGYRHYDKARKDVLFPFGHGLSYAKFRYRNLIIENTLIEKGELKLSIDVTNLGWIGGQEVVQVYIGEMRPVIDRPVFGLKAFSKIFLEPNETKTVTITLTEQAFRYYDEKLGRFNITGGDFKILVGSSSRDIRLSDVIFVEAKSTILKEQYKTIPIPNKAELGHRNHTYNRNNIDAAMTFVDLRKVSLNGWLLYQAIRIGSTSMVPKTVSKATLRMVRKSAVEMPLRQIALFSGGKIGPDGVQGIIMIAQGKLFKGVKMLQADMKKRRTWPDKAKIYSA